VAFIAVFGAVFGVEPICRVLQVAPSSYYAARGRQPSARARRDELLMAKILQVWETTGRRVYGARKVWWELQAQGLDVARCTVERLMRALGIAGTTRGKARKTTVPDPAVSRPGDLVNRDFTAAAPNRRWVADITYIPVRTGFVYAAFVLDLFSRKIVGWKVSASLAASLALDALEMAVSARFAAGQAADGLVHHSDRGAQYLSIKYTRRLAEAGAVASVGSKGDSYDNAAAETLNGLYKTELIRHDVPEDGWEGVRDVEAATAGYVGWYNNTRRHSACARMSPAEFEAAWHARQHERELEGEPAVVPG
jgi:putative transposase